MPSNIQFRLNQRFSAPLADFYKRRIIFWNDEDGEFCDVVDEITIPNANVVKLTGRNGFAVKKLLTTDDKSGNYLIYNPIAYKRKEDNWLKDIELFSEDFRADRTSERLEMLHIDASDKGMRETIKKYKKFFDSKERESKLLRLSTNYQVTEQLHTDILAVLCGLYGGGMPEIIVAVLSAGLDKEANSAIDNITRFGDIEEFWRLANKYTGYVYDEARPLADFAAHVLLTALAQNISGSAFGGLERFVSNNHKDFCYSLIHEWQRDADSDMLLDICRKIEAEMRLVSRFEKLENDALIKCDTFPSMNEIILKNSFTAICESIVKPEYLIKIVETRRIAGWHEIVENYFECLLYAAKILEFKISFASGFHKVEARGILHDYKEQLFLMDLYYRKFHLYFGKAVESPNDVLDDGLKKVAETIENIYHNWFLKELNASWTNSIADEMKERGCVFGIRQQSQFYRNYVKPLTKQGKRAIVIISDALRYEVAVELSEKLCHDTKGKATCEAEQAIFPSITKFGMAALLPCERISINDKCDVFIDGKPTGDTLKREAILRVENPKSVATTYIELIRMKKQERRELVKDMDVVYIYHNIIDAVGEQTENKVFDACETAIEQIISTIKIILGDLSSTNIFITADHGFLYTYSALEESNKISKDVFSGDIHEIGRRHALTAADTSAEYLLPIHLNCASNEKDLKGFAPRETVRIKTQGGGINYVHGGVSLQEMIVPVVVYKGARSDYKSYVESKNTGLALLSESRKVTNKIFKLDFFQKEAVSEKVQPCTYKLFFVDTAGNTVSDTRTIIADKADDNASLRVYRVQFSLKSIQFSKSENYRLVITNDIDVPEEIEFSIELLASDDFGF